MGKKGKQSSQTQSSSSDDLLTTLGDFTSKENWDKFFTIRGADDSFEWYAEWPQLSQPLLSLLSASPSSPEILVPGCGNSRLSEHLYDAGLKSITNVDFSKVVISDMLKRNVRERPGMKWRVMDITSMRFEDKTFDAVLDKGGLDALMEPEMGSNLGNQYLSEVRRVLKPGGKFICLTLAESHVLGLLFPKFRFGWKMAVHSIPQKPSKKPSLLTFMVVAEKENSLTVLSPITSSSGTSLNRSGNQAAGLFEALERENRIRQEHLSGSDILYSLEDLQLGAKGDIMQARAHEWLFSSEEGQWLVVESAKAARLIMVTSPLTGPVIVEDVVYENFDGDAANLFPSRDLVFRRLVFQRTENLVQSEALLITNGAEGDPDQRRLSNSSAKSKKKQDLKQKDGTDSLMLSESSSLLQVYHDYLASSYHLGIVSGFVLITSYLENMASAGKKVNTVVIGLGAGLLPLFLHRSIPFLHFEVVELDPVMLNLANDYFGFAEDEDLKVHIADGIKFIGELMKPTVASTAAIAVGNGSTNSSNKNLPNSDAGDIRRPTIDVLIIDVDSADSSSGMTCPAADFVEESFLQTVKNALSKQGLFVVNLVARSSVIKEMVVSRMKTVFSHLYSLQLEEDVNMILFGLSCEESIAEESFPESAQRLEKLLKLRHPEISQSIVDGTKKIKCLK
ncbi:eEF1A lysine and N-terminal methyltransferase [Linum perenne]